MYLCPTFVLNEVKLHISTIFITFVMSCEVICCSVYFSLTEKLFFSWQNIHMVDIHLMWFIAIFLSRRVAWNVIGQVIVDELHNHDAYLSKHQPFIPQHQ